MRTVLNLLWLILAGVWLAIGYVIAAAIQVIFIITIPFAIQSLKLAGYALWPFGRVVVHKTHRQGGLSVLGNILWFVFSGIWLALLHVITGVLLCATIIGIPLGIGSFKMAGLALVPFGKEVVSIEEANRRDQAIAVAIAPPGPPAPDAIGVSGPH